jgi:hypothetical protein
MINFADLIHEFGELFGERFEPYQNRMIRFLINEHLHVQIETDGMGESLLLVCLISDLPPGRFREQVLKEALKANHLLDEQRSTLSYEEKDNQLILSLHIPTHGITAQKLLDHLLPLIKRAERWRTAIDNGHSSPGRDEVPEAKRKGIFPF